MQKSPRNSSTNSSQGNLRTIKIEEQENGETRVSISPTPQRAPPPPPPRMTTPRPQTPNTSQEGWETTIGLSTRPQYRSPHEWEEAEWKERARQEQNQLSWTASYDDGCKTHFRDKEASGWFPQDRSRSVPSVPISHRTRNNKGNATEGYGVGQMLRGQMLRPCPRKNKRRVLPAGEWRDKNSFKIVPEPPRARTTKEVQCREDTAGEGGERKHSIRRRSPTEANPGTVGRKGPIPEKQVRIPTEDNGPGNHDKPHTRRDSWTSQNRRGNWLQPSEVEKQDRHLEASK